MTDTAEAPEEIASDEAREALLESMVSDLGDAVVEHHLISGRDLWVRVAPDSFGDLAEYLRERQRFRFFDYVSVIDWLPSPYGRSMDSSVDTALADAVASEPAETIHGYAGGDTRFQVIARVFNLVTGLGVHIKCDVPEDTMSVASWTHVYPGADWHEREAWEMFGVTFIGHPGLQNLYLPGDFEGNPMRKDFPLLARLVKPWPGIVDVEPMPSADNPEDAS